MAETQRRRFFERASGAPTLVGAGCEVHGDVRSTGTLTLAGTIVGDGRIEGLVSIAAGSHWQGDVQARSAVVAGRVTGDLTVADKLEVGQSAVIRGNVRAKSLAIAHGAVIDGELSVTGDEPVVRFEEKRASRMES